jgi:hypothetical protein
VPRAVTIAVVLNPNVNLRVAPACTMARGKPDALLRGVDVAKPPRTTPTLASKDAWTVGPDRR